MDTPQATPVATDTDHVEVAPNRDWHLVVDWRRNMNSVWIDKHDDNGQQELRRFATANAASEWAMKFFTGRGLEYRTVPEYPAHTTTKSIEMWPL